MRSSILTVVWIAWILYLSGCSESSELTKKPVLTLKPVVVHEGNNEINSIDIEVALDQSSSLPVTIKWGTESLTAIEDQDFIPVYGQETIIPPGQTKIILPISIINDDHLEFIETFNIVLLEAENAEIMSQNASVTIIDDDRYQPEMADDGYITPLQYPDMHLTWHEEFEGTTVETDHWNFDAANGFPLNCGWGLDELGKYTGDQEHLKVKDGKLMITATRDESTGTYRTSRINTKEKVSITYGRLDIRSRIPEVAGLAAIFWLIGADMDEVGLPACGEIDILKFAGKAPEKISGGLVFENDGEEHLGQSYNKSSVSLSNQYHIYSIIWEENRIRWFFDYYPYFEVRRDDFSHFKIFEKPFFLTINLAIGGEYAGAPDSSSSFPTDLEIDYIRLYQRNPDNNITSIQ